MGLDRMLVAAIAMLLPLDGTGGGAPAGCVVH